jgi:flagellar hook-associated protein 2
VSTGSTATTINVASGASLADVVTAINSSGSGVTAAAVQVSAGSFRLQLTSDKTGSGSGVTVSAGAFPAGTSGLGDLQELTAGADTVLHVGTGIGAYDVTSATTTVTGLLPGVTITAVKADPAAAVTVTVTRDSGGIADKIKALVDQSNSVLSYVAGNSTYNADRKTAGPLLGNSLSDGVSRQILNAVIGTSTSAPAVAGVSVQKDGTVAFDRAKFLAAYAKDPAAVEAALGGMSLQLAAAAKKASDPSTGLVTAQIKSQQDSITQVAKQIAGFEDRMTLRQAALERTYANLETALGTLKAQSSWLAGQLATLPTAQSTKST